MVKSLRLGAVTTRTMVITRLRDAAGDVPESIDFERCAGCLSGLKYWNVQMELPPTYYNGVAEKIKELMGRDVEVTFGSTE